MHHKSGRFSFIKKGAQKHSDSIAESTGRLIQK